MPKFPEGANSEFKIAVPPEFLAALGAICVQWGALENVLNIMISKLVDIDVDDPAGWAVTSNLGFQTKLDIVSSVANLKKREFPHLSKFDEWCKRARSLAGRRNKYVHGFWGWDKKSNAGQLLSARARRELKTKIELIDENELRLLEKDIGRASVDLMKTVIWYE